MSEYTFVERPFLQQLQSLGWQVIDQGEAPVHYPEASMRSTFRDWILRDEVIRQIQKINLTDDGYEWISDKQAQDVLSELLNLPFTSLLEANKHIFHKLVDDYPKTDRNELTNEEYPNIKLIDFDRPEQNSFIAINQFRIETPGMLKGSVRPDIVLFVNGFPMVVVECKDANEFTSNPLHEAFIQIQRYSNQREDTHEAGLREGEERLFHWNQINIITTGEEAKLGTITSTEKYYYHWKDIFPEKFKTYDPPLGTARPQENLLQGVLPPEILLDLIRHFVLFAPLPEGGEVKVIARYQQYRAVGKIVDRLLTGKTPLERSGVVWHTQGSGKSFTMVMLVRKLRSIPELKDYKVLLINDRTNLEEQLGETAELTNETIDYVESIGKLREKLSTPSSNVVMVMIHKFQELKENQDSIVGRAIATAAEPIPRYGNFGVINDSDRILILIDEAHRTQSSDFGDNLFEAFPNSTKIAFTGTPLITERHEGHRTIERFGSYIDKYRLQDAVDDGATVQILYEGKTADSAISHKQEFDQKFEDLVKEHTPEEIEAIKRKYGTYRDVLESEAMINPKAEDMVRHYLTNIFPNGLKAQVVATSVLAAIRYKQAIELALQKVIAEETAKPDTAEVYVRQLEKLKVYAVVTSQGTNEDAIVTKVRKEASSGKAVDNFKKAFKPDDLDSYTAFLVVCDMLLTGFDAPVEQVMYLDKKMKEHNLLQAIARVNRTYKGKSRGYIVDYVGVSNHLKDALEIYGGEAKELMDGFLSIESEVPVMEMRFNRLIKLFEENGVRKINDFVYQLIDDPKEEYNVLEQCIDLAKELHFRADFDVYLKNFLESMDIILPKAPARPYRIPAKRFGYIHAQIKQRYKDNTITLGDVGKKIKKLVDEYLVSLGIDPMIPPVELFSSDFNTEIQKRKSKKAVASEMEHAIRKHIKISFEDDPSYYRKLSEKLEDILHKHREEWDQQVTLFSQLRQEMEDGRKNLPHGMTQAQALLYDNLRDIADKKQTISGEQQDVLKAFTKDLTVLLQHWIGIEHFWEKPYEIKKLEGEITLMLYDQELVELFESKSQLITEIMLLVKRRTHDILKDG